MHLRYFKKIKYGSKFGSPDRNKNSKQEQKQQPGGESFPARLAQSCMPMHGRIGCTQAEMCDKVCKYPCDPLRTHTFSTAGTCAAKICQKKM